MRKLLTPCLSIISVNHKVAINMLEREFLDKEFIIDETYKEILNSNPGTNIDPEYASMKIFLK